MSIREKIENAKLGTDWLREGLTEEEIKRNLEEAAKEVELHEWLLKVDGGHHRRLEVKHAGRT